MASLIRRGAGEYEAKRISEAEQKRAQGKARAKASPTELSSSDLSCSICNRQFRAKIGLMSRLRTHKHSSIMKNLTEKKKNIGQLIFHKQFFIELRHQTLNAFD